MENIEALVNRYIVAIANHNIELADLIEERIAENIQEAVGNQQFYKIPFENILSILDYVSLSNQKDPVYIVETLIKKLKSLYPEKILFIFEHLDFDQISFNMESLNRIIDLLDCSFFNVLKQKINQELFSVDFDWDYLLAQQEKKIKSLQKLSLSLILKQSNKYQTQKNIDIHKAAQEGNLPRLINLIQKQKVDVECRDVSGNTPLLTACRAGNLETVAVLVDLFDADLSAKNIYGSTALHAACKSNNVKLVKYLIEEKEIPTNVVDNCSWTPYFVSEVDNKYAVFEYLTSIGVNS